MNQQKQFQFYTYVHCNEQNIPFYVGKGKQNRAFDTKCRGKIWKDYVKKHPFIPENVRIYQVDSETQAFELEKELVWLLRTQLGLWLANATDGGEGSAGYKFDQEDVKRRAELHSQNFKGHTFTIETRAKISKTLLGRKRSLESIEKTRLANLGLKRTQDQRQNIKASNPGLKAGAHAHQAVQKANATKLAKKLGNYIIPICIEVGCDKPQKCQERCLAHYGKLWRNKRINEIGRYKNFSLPHPLKETT